MITKGWVYTLKKSGAVVYVGQTSMKNGVKLRVGAHKRDKDFDTICAREVSIENMMKIEAMLIAQYCPKYNKKLSSAGGYKTRSWIVNSISKNITDKVKHAVDESINLDSDIINLNGIEYCETHRAKLIVDLITKNIDVELLNKNISDSVSKTQLFDVVLSGCITKRLTESLKECKE